MAGWDRKELGEHFCDSRAGLRSGGPSHQVACGAVLADPGGAGRTTVREAHRGGEEQQFLVAAAGGGVHAGAEPAVERDLAERVPGRPGLRPARRRHAGGQGQGGRGRGEAGPGQRRGARYSHRTGHRRRRQGDRDRRPGQPGEQGLERGRPRRQRPQVNRARLARTAWRCTSPGRSAPPPTRATRSRGSTARCFTPRSPSSSCCCCSPTAARPPGCFP